MVSGPAVSELVSGDLFVHRWEAVAHLVLWTERRLVVPLFLFSGALLLFLGDADDGAVDVGPGAISDQGAGAFGRPGLYPAILALALGIQLFVTSPLLSYLISVRLEQPAVRSGLLSRITRGMRFRDRWNLMLAISGLRGMSVSLEAAVDVAGSTHGPGRQLYSFGVWSRRVVFGLTVAAIVIVVILGGDAGFEWRQ